MTYPCIYGNCSVSYTSNNWLMNCGEMLPNWKKPNIGSFLLSMYSSMVSATSASEQDVNIVL